MARRTRIEPTDDLLRLLFCFDWPQEEAYELVRSVVLGERSPVGPTGGPELHPRRYRHGQREGAHGVEHVIQHGDWVVIKPVGDDYTVVKDAVFRQMYELAGGSSGGG